jgi:hypothetical protein
MTLPGRGGTPGRPFSCIFAPGRVAAAGITGYSG